MISNYLLYLNLLGTTLTFCAFRYNIIKAIKQFYHIQPRFQSPMLDQTDVFEVLSFQDQKEIQQVKIDSQGLSFLLSQNQQPSHQQTQKNAALLLNVPNQFEEEYHQPIRKRSLQAFVAQEEIQEDETALKDYVKQWSAQVKSHQEVKNEEKNVVRSMFHLSHFCENRSSHSEKKKKELQNPQNASHLVSKTSRLKTQGSINQVIVLHKKDRFYWHLQHDIEISIDLIKRIYDQMLEKECFVPIFSFRNYSQWQKAKSKNKEVLAQSQKVLKVYLQTYTAFLNLHYSQELQVIFSTLEQSKPSIQANFRKKTAKEQKRYSQEICEMKFDIGSIIEGIFHIIVSSKSQILRKIVLQKIRSLSATRRQCQHLQLMEYAKHLFQKQQQNWQTLSQIDFLLSLQASEGYCLKKIDSFKQRAEREFWLKYHSFICKSIREVKQSQLLHIYI